MWAADLLRCATWALVRDTGSQAPPHTCRIRTSGVGHSTLGFNKAPHSRGFRGRPGMLNVWMRPAGRVSPGVGGGAWGLQSSPTCCPRVWYKEDPFLGVPAGEKGLGAYLRNTWPGETPRKVPC